MAKLIGKQDKILDHRYNMRITIYYKNIKKDKNGRYRNMVGEYVTAIKDFGMKKDEIVYYR